MAERTTDTRWGRIREMLRRSRVLRMCGAHLRNRSLVLVHHVVEACNSVDYAHTERTPLPFLSGLVDDCIGKGLSLQHGGAVYNFTGPQAFGVADCGDSIYAMQTHVFENKELTMAQLKDALDHNFGCGCCETASDDEPGFTRL